QLVLRGMSMKHSALCALAIVCSPVTRGALPAAEPLREELARKVREVFTTNCYRCHGKDGANEGGFNYVLDRQRLLERRKVIAGEPAKSRLYRRVSSSDDPMPPIEEKLRPSESDLAAIRKWIETGAADFNTTAVRRTFISQADV